MIDKSVDIVYYNDNSNDYCYLRIKRNTNIKSYREKEIIIMKKWVCTVCGWVYDEELGDQDYDLAPGVAFEDLPEDFVCPLCGVGKDQFEEEA